MRDDQLNLFDKVQPVDIEDEMRRAYIDYAMSVIVARALPDVRDGLKPVHRRILHAMNDLGLDPGKPFRKSARIVGDTMGKYHPHGDSSIYDAMVRMAQEFSMRYPLVEGHGNFGSVDGDEPAAQRYTEARFSKIAKEMLADIEKDTVDFIPNFDEEEKEPTVLPSRFPNLLVNGSSGIAVGMATNIPPHNLKEVINASVKILDNQIEGTETDINDLLKLVKGPDFPTGGLILGHDGIKDAYTTGRGKVRVRAKVEIEPMHGDRERIVVRELPYQVNKAKLCEKIGELVRDKKIDGISDLRDESDRNGMRLVVELKRDANSNVVLNQLYKYTQLQDTFGVISIALVDGEPRTLTLMEMLEHYLEHQKNVVTRRTRFDLEKALRRAHILEGLIIALDNLDEVLDIMRTSKNIPHSKERLTERFGMTDEQTQAVVQMTLGRLTGLEREKIEEEYKQLSELIAELRSILADEKKLLTVIKDELSAIRDKYGDKRRTAIVADVEDIDFEDLIEEQTDVITMTHMGYIKRIPLNTYKSQNRGGKGIIGMNTREDDFIKRMFISSNLNYVMFFTNLGKVYRMKAYEVPEASRTARGMAIVNLLSLSAGEKVNAVIPISKEDNGFLLMTTKRGIVKKTPLSDFANVHKGGIIAINLKDDDKLISVSLTDGERNVFLATRKGMGIMFSESDVRASGRVAIGVKGIKLNAGDYVVASEVVTDETAKVLAVTEKGFGKCTEISEFNVQGRSGKGLKIYRITPKSGEVAGVDFVKDEDELMLITSEGVIIRLRVGEINTFGRVTQGVKLMNLADGVSVVGMAKIDESSVESGENTENAEEQDPTL